ncbi:MAG: Dihydroorotate dehydrogenase electron transfer subunit [Paenibacillaceae bacterium]|jgi:dihydroorotate dehydrogenase electron transfer subunit|nr:Dihydroorotate dehydrogenase electron transfer subunit [Paenibacillaceae bacterium]
MKNESMRVVSQQLLARHIYELVLEGGLAEEMGEPGRFVHVKAEPGTDPLLRRPISICEADTAKGQFTMIYRAEGKGTRQLAAKQPGDYVDVLGPLGRGFPVQEASPGETALLIGGGIGVPPLYYLSKQLLARGVRPVHVLGFAAQEDVFYQDKFSALGETYLATVDGSCGDKGFVTDVIAERGLTFDVLYACGPTPMLKALDVLYRDVKGFLSLEERMGCGVGACYACVCKVQGDETGLAYRKVCKDGPVFPIGEVVL